MTVYESWSLALQILTIIGIGFAGLQVFYAQKSYQEAREQAFYNSYRDSLNSIPSKYFLGTPLEASFDLLPSDVQQAFFVYIDLCNEQVFAHDSRKISKRTWKNWETGIKGNFRLPAFLSAWEYIRTKSGSYDELNRLVTVQI